MTGAWHDQPSSPGSSGVAVKVCRERVISGHQNQGERLCCAGGHVESQRELLWEDATGVLGMGMASACRHLCSGGQVSLCWHLPSNFRPLVTCDHRKGQWDVPNLPCCLPRPHTTSIASPSPTQLKENKIKPWIGRGFASVPDTPHFLPFGTGPLWWISCTWEQ